MQPIFFIWPLVGGVLIGLSAGLYFLLVGRIAGISGLVAKAVRLAEEGFGLQGLLFVVGLVGGAGAASLTIRTPNIVYAAAPWQIVLAGVLVGFGVRLGSGCTSGHGVCGIARLSPRSIAATGILMATAFVTVFVNRHLLGGFFG